MLRHLVVISLFTEAPLSAFAFRAQGKDAADEALVVDRHEDFSDAAVEANATLRGIDIREFAEIVLTHKCMEEQAVRFVELQESYETGTTGDDGEDSLLETFALASPESKRNPKTSSTRKGKGRSSKSLSNSTKKSRSSRKSKGRSSKPKSTGSSPESVTDAEKEIPRTTASVSERDTMSSAQSHVPSSIGNSDGDCTNTFSWCRYDSRSNQCAPYSCSFAVKIEASHAFVTKGTLIPASFGSKIKNLAKGRVFIQNKALGLIEKVDVLTMQSVVRATTGAQRPSDDNIFRSESTACSCEADTTNDLTIGRKDGFPGDTIPKTEKGRKALDEVRKYIQADSSIAEGTRNKLGGGRKLSKELFATLTKEKATLTKSLEDMGLGAAKLQESCRGGEGDATRQCVRNAAKRFSSGRVELKSLTNLMDVEEYLAVYEGTHAASVHATVEVRAEVLRATVEETSFPFESTQQMCRKTTLENMAGLIDFTDKQMLDPVHQQWGSLGKCEERKKSFCPEGTAVSVTDRFTPVAAAASLPATFGVAGLLAASFTVLMGTLTGGMAPVVAAGAGVSSLAIGSKWKKTRCACFRRACEYDAKSDSCVVGDKHMKDALSKNPFGGLLPLSGWKCKMVSQAPKMCEYEACSGRDFGIRSSDSVGTAVAAKGMYGMIGRNGTDLWNCLSKTGSPSTSLLVVPSLVGGVENTPESRAEMYVTLKVAT